MKFYWRITKYDPQYRNQEGVFLKNEWTSYSDIGYAFDNIQLTYKIYEKIEYLYIEAIKSMMKCHPIKCLQVKSLEKSGSIQKDVHNTAMMITLFNAIKENAWVEEEYIEDFCKLILRDKLWCKLTYTKKIFIHFGWDFYMYIGSSSACTQTVEEIQNSGLFVEIFKSPYQK